MCGLQNFKEVLNSLRIAKNFFLVALAIRVEESKANMMNAIAKFDNTLSAMISGDENLNIIASPNQDVSEPIHKWNLFEHNDQVSSHFFIYEAFRATMCNIPRFSKTAR